LPQNVLAPPLVYKEGKETKMEDAKKGKGAVAYYAEGGLRDPVCCICGEKAPEREFRGQGVCAHCIEYIRSKGLIE
jgi:hypothetical protein